jgi:hypothetical protein
MFGVLRRLRPRIVILTDGGGEERVAQSRQGLQRIGLLESTTFLDWREADFYDALLDRDVPFFRGVAAQVGREIAGIQAEHIPCDALREQLRSQLDGLPDEHFATEVIAPAAATLIEPASDQTLRYDWRARLLADRGDVDRPIARSEHYLPIARELIADPVFAPEGA